MKSNTNTDEPNCALVKKVSSQTLRASTLFDKHELGLMKLSDSIENPYLTDIETICSASCRASSLDVRMISAWKNRVQFLGFETCRIESCL